jgi:uncharacterized protein involved in exopolysaccharide biosynthesis
MPEPTKPATQDSLSMGDIYYLLFRHKAPIIFCLLMGVLAAVGLFYVTPTVFRSEARLLVRYVTEMTVLDPAANQSGSG